MIATPARRRIRHGSTLAALVLGALLMAAGGCDYFHPAAPENPGPGSPVVPIDLSSTEGTLETLREAVEAKGLQGGDVAYRACFADSTGPTTPAFHAFFFPEDANAWTSQGKVVPPDWTLKDEGPFYNVGPRSLANLRDEPYQMTWERERPDDFGTGSVVMHIHYLVVAVGSGGGVVEILAKGYADLILVQSAAGNWVIVQWQDRSDPDIDPTLPQKTWGLRRLESR